MTDAGEMGHRAQSKLALNSSDQINRLSPGAAAGAVGNRDIGRLQRVQVANGAIKLGEARFVFGWEELEGNGRPPAAHQRVDTHADTTPEDFASYATSSAKGNRWRF